MTRPLHTAIARLSLPVALPSPRRWWASLTPLERFDWLFWLLVACYPLAVGLAWVVFSYLYPAQL